MHKKQASTLFAVLAHEDRAKMLKIFYNNTKVTFSQLSEVICCEEAVLNDHLKLFIDNDLLFCITEGNHRTFVCNKELVNELINFVTSPIGCYIFD